MEQKMTNDARIPIEGTMRLNSVISVTKTIATLPNDFRMLRCMRNQIGLSIKRLLVLRFADAMSSKRGQALYSKVLQ